MFNKVITEIYEKKMIRSILENMRIADTDIDDLEQEIYMILLDYNKDKIIDMYNKKQLNYFCVGIWKSPVCVTPEAQVPLTLESKFRMTPIKS